MQGDSSAVRPGRWSGRPWKGSSGLITGDPSADLQGIASEGSLRHLGIVPIGGDAGGHAHGAVGHRRAGLTIVEFEPVLEGGLAGIGDLYPLTSSIIARLRGRPTWPSSTRSRRPEVRRITGFDRVLIYRFDEDWNGTVIAEDRNEVLPVLPGAPVPRLGHPEQARELYRAEPAPPDRRRRVPAGADRAGRGPEHGPAAGPELRDAAGASRRSTSST